MMRHHGGLKNDEANNAAWEAGKGAVADAARVCYFSTFGNINRLTVATVGHIYGHLGRRRLLIISYIPRSDNTV